MRAANRFAPSPASMQPPLTSVSSDVKRDKNYLSAASSTSQADELIRYKVFCVTWASATLFHLAQSRLYTTSLYYALLTTAAILLILRPASMLRLTALLTLQLYEIPFQLPYVSNHWLFTAFVNLTILQAVVYLIVRDKTLRVDKVSLIRLFAPVVRLEVIILYFFVVLHKLNWSFLTADASCAAMLYNAQHLEGLIPIAGPIVKYTIYLTLITETLIPVLLIFRKTRNIGLLVGLLFHGIIGLNYYNGFYDFSGMIFAVYVLFSSFSFTNLVAGFSGRWTKWRATFREGLRQFNTSYLIILFSVFLGGLAALAYLNTHTGDYFRLVWALYSSAFIILFLMALKKQFWQPFSPAFAPPNTLFLLFPALVFVNGISPYLGLKTESSFSMFSNLRTEGGITNHVFMPISLQLFDFQKDMVEVIFSTDEQLQGTATKHRIIPYFLFKNHVANARPEQVMYIRNGQQRTFTLATAPPNDELRQRSPFLMRKLLGFRAVSKYEPQPCEH